MMQAFVHLISQTSLLLFCFMPSLVTLLTFPLSCQSAAITERLKYNYATFKSMPASTRRDARRRATLGEVSRRNTTRCQVNIIPVKVQVHLQDGGRVELPTLSCVLPAWGLRLIAALGLPRRVCPKTCHISYLRKQL